MNMADILDQWDDIKKKEKAAAREKVHTQQVSHKKANAPTAQEKELAQAKKNGSVKESQPQINPMEYWLNRYGTVDKDKIAEELTDSHYTIKFSANGSMLELTDTKDGKTERLMRMTTK